MHAHYLISYLAGDNVEDVVAVMKLLCYELMDLKTGGAKLVGLFRSNMDQLVCILTNKTDLVGCLNFVTCMQSSLWLKDGQVVSTCVLCLLSMQLSSVLHSSSPLQIFAQAGDEFALNRTPNTRACKYALNVLMNIFQAPVLAQVRL